MTRTRTSWGFAGVAAAGLFLAGFWLIGNSGDTGGEVMAFYAENRARSIVAFLCFAAAALAYVCFTAALRGVLAQAEAEPRTLTALGYGGGLLTAALLVVGAAPTAALPEAAKGAAAGSSDAFWLVSNLTYPVVTTGIAFSSLLALATGVVALRSGVLPRWFAWASIVAAPLILVAVVFLPIFVWMAWTAVAGVLVAVAEPRVAAVPATR
ncbi:MAG TPA: DUF4386 family protein [Gaiellaceae bacterium]|nr:DUF4386 family protein [Gaiellaceae bacterium]